MKSEREKKGVRTLFFSLSLFISRVRRSQIEVRVRMREWKMQNDKI